MFSTAVRTMYLEINDYAIYCILGSVFLTTSIVIYGQYVDYVHCHRIAKCKQSVITLRLPR